MRQKFIAGNWKMNKTLGEAEVLIKDIVAAIGNPKCGVAVFPPYISIAKVKESAGDHVIVGAQNCHYVDSGAYTGEISLPMLLSVGVTHILIGHSERREYYGETDDLVNKKVLAALNKGIVPVICVGEPLAVRDSKQYNDYVKNQVKQAFSGVPDADAAKCIIAYEPIWAIGTGRTATKEEAEEVCDQIRQRMARIYGGYVADNVRILYGGSMNAANAATLLTMPNIDGGLIGGAALKPNDFAEIVNAANKLSI